MDKYCTNTPRRYDIYPRINEFQKFSFEEMEKYSPVTLAFMLYETSKKEKFHRIRKAVNNFLIRHFCERNEESELNPDSWLYTETLLIAKAEEEDAIIVRNALEKSFIGNEEMLNMAGNSFNTFINTKHS
jgi:hypothetical protein